jgi:predicted ATPase/DNA-binding CsgD family transcriptional regulator
VWLVELAALEDGELLTRTVAAALGLVDRSARPPVECLLDYLAGRRLLLVLDNCEHLLDACAVLVDKLLAAVPGLRVLATSRQALGMEGEQILEVPPLSVPDGDKVLPAGALGEYEAVRLFAERAAAVVPDFAVTDANRAVVAGVCRRLDGIPLAIELAAVRLRALSAEQILERLEDRFRLLTKGGRAAVSRQRTLRATIDWSFAMCSPGERALWARASVFAGGFDLKAAEAVCGGDGIADGDVMELVAGLADKSVLLRQEHELGARYRLLETIRQYGRERLAESGREEILRVRHRDWYQRLAEPSATERFGPDHARWVARVDREWANLRVALDFCLTQPGQARAGLAIAAALRDYWLVVGSVGTAEGSQWLDRALARTPEEPSRTRVEALWCYVWLAQLRGDMATGLGRLREWRTLARQLGDSAAFLHVVEFSGLIALGEGDLRRAFALLEQALARHRTASDVQNLWYCLLHLAVAAFAAGRPAPYGEQTLMLAEAHDSPWHRPYGLWIAGLDRLQRGDLARATTLLRESLRVSQRLRATLDDPWRIAHCLEGLAWNAAAAGEHQRAARLFGAAGRLWQSPGTPAAGALVHPHGRYEAQVRQALGEAAFTTASQHGAALTTDQAIAYALAAKPAAAPPPPAVPGAPAVLTRRERQVADLLAQGLSNKDIAARLVIAQRTAETHVENILNKLGFSSRTQAAVWISGQRTST